MKAKRGLSLILSLFLLVGIFPVTASAFSDVSPTAYYADAVQWAVENNITNGTGNGRFSPDMSCTRAQAVTFLWRSVGSPIVNSTTRFSDVPENAYYADAVRWAAWNGIANGTGNGKFSPNVVCTRAQIVTFLYRMDWSPDITEKSSFSDVPSGKYYFKAVSWAVSKNIALGIGNGRFDPDGKCTRGQIVTFLYRASKPETIINLLDGYWENNIQCPKIYKFYEDGTAQEYNTELTDQINPISLEESRKLRYRLNGTTLTLIYEDGYTTVLEWVSKSDNHNWDSGIEHNLPTDESFFYEVSWVRPPYPDNAMYLVKSKTHVQNIITSSISEQELLGEWTVDTKYTMEFNDMSMIDLYGTIFSHSGNKMTFTSNNSFKYYVSWCYGEGTFQMKGEKISIKLDRGEPVDRPRILLVTSDGTTRIAMDPLGNGNLTFWIKT